MILCADRLSHDRDVEDSVGGRKGGQKIRQIGVRKNASGQYFVKKHRIIMEFLKWYARPPRGRRGLPAGVQGNGSIIDLYQKKVFMVVAREIGAL